MSGAGWRYVFEAPRQDKRLRPPRLAGQMTATSRSMAERELRRTEAWAAPSGRAFYVSLFALFISALAPFVSIARL